MFPPQLLESAYSRMSGETLPASQPLRDWLVEALVTACGGLACRIVFQPRDGAASPQVSPGLLSFTEGNRLTASIGLSWPLS